MTLSPRVPRLGAWVEGGTTYFSVVTDARECSVRFYDERDEPTEEHSLLAVGDDTFEIALAGARHGTAYRFVIRERALPDPYARSLPRGVHGAAVLAPSHYEWRSGSVSRPLGEQVVYELHVGTFTREGTYESAASRLPGLVELGVTTLELMPLAAFDGKHGWGYDGVAHYAPHAPYGKPDELRAFVDRAHGLGLSVLLDVVYNHFGPSGNYLAAYDPRYFVHDEASPWGQAPNFAFSPMRRYVVDNALYWLREFRFDGLRLDATHALIDRSPKHVLKELAEAVGTLEPKRLLVAEDARNDPALVSELGLDALWADDFHHAVRVTLTGERDGYYGAYTPGAAGIARTIQRGWLYEGQVNAVSGMPRGKAADALRAEQFVYCIQNHDQVGNRALGDRLNHAVSLDAYLSVSLLLLFLPMTPLLFMGQEWASSCPFLYFTDHEAELGKRVTEGRLREFSAFAAFSQNGEGSPLPDPQALETFRRSTLDWSERDQVEHTRALETYRAALKLRREDAVLRDPSRERLKCETVGDVLVVERWADGERRILLVNFGARIVAYDEISAIGSTEVRVLLSNPSDADVRALPPNGAVVLASSAGAHSPG